MIHKILMQERMLLEVMHGMMLLLKQSNTPNWQVESWERLLSLSKHHHHITHTTNHMDQVDQCHNHQVTQMQ
jgi:hypothetical protein